MADPARAEASAALFLDGETSNALSLPTWAVHVSSVIEWITAMGLMWQYGEVSRNKSWKGLSWGMVPLLGGVFCACVWHFLYNSEFLEVLVALQAALTVLGNVTMCLASFRIYRSSEECSKTCEASAIPSFGSPKLQDLLFTLYLVAILISIFHIPPPWKAFTVDKLCGPANDLE